EAVRDLREVVLAQLLLLLHAERAVVGRHHLELVHAQGLPEELLVALVLGAQRRGGDPLRALELAPLLTVRGQLILEAEVEVLRAGLAEHIGAASTGLRDLHRRLLSRDVDEVEGARSEEHTSELQSRENLVCRLLLEKKKPISVDTDI